MIKKTIIFDFDGTIADTLGIVLEIYNKIIVPKFKTKKVSKEELEYLRTQKPSKKLLNKYNISLLQLPFVLKTGRAEIKKEIKRAKIQPGLKELFNSLKDYSLGILSSNSKENIQAFLKNYGFLEVFDFFYTSSALFKKDKVIKKILQERNLDSENVFYIGDELRDITAANKAGIKTIAVSWGFNKKEILETANPDYFAEKPLEILDFIRG
jgi:phosphoglycolate phosphatase